MAVWNVVNHTELSSGNATLIDVTSISSSYDHLYLMASIRSDKASTKRTNAEIQFNGDTGNNYDTCQLYSGGGNVTPNSYKQNGVDSFDDIECAAADCLADTFSSLEMWIYNYSNTTHYKQCLMLGATPNNDAAQHMGGMKVTSGLWSDTSAIDRIKIFQGSDDFVQYSSVTIYGINGAA